MELGFQQPGLSDESSSHKVQVQLSDSLLQLPSVILDENGLARRVIEQLAGVQPQAGQTEEKARQSEQQLLCNEIDKKTGSS